MHQRNKLLIDNLNRLILEREMYPSQLSYESNISESLISMWLSGDRYPSFKSLKKLSKALKVPIDEITGLEDDELALAQKIRSEKINSHVREEPSEYGINPSNQWIQELAMRWKNGNQSSREDIKVGLKLCWPKDREKIIRFIESK